MNKIKDYLDERTRNGKDIFALLAVYIAFYIASTVYFATKGQPRDAILSAVFVLFAPLMLFIEFRTNIRMKLPFAIGAIFLLIGSTLGSGYDLYTTVPVWDNILHAFSGFFFGCLGYALFMTLMGEPRTGKQAFTALLFGFCFCMMIALLWEMFEYLGYVTTGADMEEDMVVSTFHSYFLSGTHVVATDVNGILRTVIYLNNGQTITIEGGYLDIGLFDTLNDMAICLIGNIVYLILLPISKRFNGVVYRYFVPYVSRVHKSVDYVRVPDLYEAYEAAN